MVLLIAFDGGGCLLKGIKIPLCMSVGLENVHCTTSVKSVGVIPAIN